MSLTFAYSASAQAKNASSERPAVPIAQRLALAGGSSFQPSSSSKSLWIRHSPSRAIRSLAIAAS